ncbi:hypothetical protein EUTSA_v10017307mg [Eutrema salsugineum]|uniref:Glucosidase II beta subunit N-terminal domain-containing protein n=1 Tax=Eutrema salsugineum TaxID=72664 RepID=V4LQR0_EUTSA|nr:hypothetical protein EUTSA_v10017307mg [Eutrema salsugineum]
MSRNKFTLLHCVSSFLLVVSGKSTSPLVGVHPLDEKYFDSDIIRCKDGSKSFPRDRLNDNFCDCLDGTDEPDCCDGSDEYESGIHCPNTCIMGGNVNYIYKPRTDRKSIDRQLGSTIDPKGSKTTVNLQEMVKNLQGMKLVFALQLVLISFLVILWMLRRRARCKRRRCLPKNVHPNR